MRNTLSRPRCASLGASLGADFQRDYRPARHLPPARRPGEKAHARDVCNDHQRHPGQRGPRGLARLSTAIAAIACIAPQARLNQAAVKTYSRWRSRCSRRNASSSRTNPTTAEATPPKQRSRKSQRFGIWIAALSGDGPDKRCPLQAVLADRPGPRSAGGPILIGTLERPRHREGTLGRLTAISPAPLGNPQGTRPARFASGRLLASLEAHQPPIDAGVGVLVVPDLCRA